MTYEVKEYNAFMKSLFFRNYFTPKNPINNSDLSLPQFTFYLPFEVSSLNLSYNQFTVDEIEVISF